MSSLQTISLPTVLLERIVPFFILWDANGALEHASAPIQRYLGLRGAFDASGLHLVRPFEAAFETHLFEDLTNLGIDLRHMAAPSRELRGELHQVGDGRLDICLCSADCIHFGPDRVWLELWRPSTSFRFGQCVGCERIGPEGI